MLSSARTVRSQRNGPPPFTRKRRSTAKSVVVADFNVISLPVDVDRDLAADLVDLFGLINPSSLLIGPPAFVLRDGVLTAEDLPGFDAHPG